MAFSLRLHNRKFKIRLLQYQTRTYERSCKGVNITFNTNTFPFNQTTCNRIRFVRIYTILMVAFNMIFFYQKEIRSSNLILFNICRMNGLPTKRAVQLTE